MEFQTLNLNTTSNENLEAIERTETRFWKRQFQLKPTKNQKIFDIVFGIALPTACFLFDPIVFRGSEFGAAEFGSFKPFVYLLSYVSIMALLAFMLWGEKLKWLNGFLSGLFASAALISMSIGLILLPLSLLGLLFFLIGTLGFTPLFTGFVFWRNSVLAFKTAKPILGNRLAVNMLILAAIVSFTIPEIINAKICIGLETIRTGDAQTIRRTTRNLKIFAPILNADSLDTADENPERKAALADAFYELNGNVIEDSGTGFF